MVGVAAIALVAHVSVLQGHGTISRAEGGTVVALRNAPLLTGDTFATLGSTNAEIAFEPAIAVRLDDDTAIQLLDETIHHRDARLLGGTIDLSASGSADAPRIETPSVTIAPDAPDLIRISVVQGITVVLARRGTLRILTPNGTQILSPGEMVTVEGDPSAPTLHYSAPPGNDAFDGFNETRDATPSGLDDLARYGSWVTIGRYGRAWRPRESTSWAPYRDGRWFYRAGIGWTWIAHASWGWIPYRYGAWTYDAKDAWCWVPPRAAKTPLAWSASNAVFFSVLKGGHTQSIGWIPLAPAEPFHARVSAYLNAVAPGGISVLPLSQFYSGAFSHVATPTLASLPQTLRLQAPRRPAPTYQRAPSASKM